MRKIVRASFGALLVLSLVMSFLPVPERDADESQEIPKRLARLVVERQAPPPPPPPVVREEPVEHPPVVEPERVVEERRVEPEPESSRHEPRRRPSTRRRRRASERAAPACCSSPRSCRRCATNADAAATRLERTGTAGAGTAQPPSTSAR